MSVHGVCSPQEPRGRTVSDAPAGQPWEDVPSPATASRGIGRGSAATTLEPAGQPWEDVPSSPATASRGIGRGPAVTTLEPVPISGATEKPDSAVLQQAFSAMNAALKEAKPNDAISSSRFYFSVTHVLNLMTDARITRRGVETTDASLEDATDRLVQTCLNDNTYEPGVKTTYAAYLRAASNLYRQSVALGSLAMEFSGKDRVQQESARMNNILHWIMPHKNEPERGHVQPVGHKIFTRLLTAASHLPPSEAAVVMARFYDAYQKANIGQIPIYEDSAKAIDDLERCIAYATWSPELGKARDLITLYRTQTEAVNRTIEEEVNRESLRTNPES